jgi:MFS family permease
MRALLERGWAGTDNGWATFQRAMANALTTHAKSIGPRLIMALHRIPAGFAHYLDARRGLLGSVSKQSRLGLDWMNFFLADVQTGFGAFVAFYLAELGWDKSQVGLALSVGTIAGLVAHIPGGALVDAITWKRGLAAIGIGMIAVSALILAVVPTFSLVFVAEVLHGVTGGIVTPAIAAISLGLVGRRAMSARTGRNFRFDAAGNAVTAGAMGLAGQYIAKSAIFFGAAALCVPALFALGCIRGNEIDYARARNAGIGKHATTFQRIFDLGKNFKLYIFAACIFLFQFADASMLPVIGQDLAKDQGQQKSLFMAGLIVAPQLVVALLSPWIGYHSERFGRKPLLLVGFGLEIVRALLFANYSSEYSILILAQLIGGISAAAVTVLTVLMVTDLTAGTGRFNLVQGFVGTVIAIAAALSTGATGFMFEQLGRSQGFLILTGVSASATALLWIAMPETKPGAYLD